MSEPFVLTLEYPAPRVPLSANEAHGQGWAAIRRGMEPWKWRTKQALEEPALRMVLLDHRERPRPVTVLLTLPFTTVRRRDPHNYTSTVVKAAVDGIVRAGYVPDDTDAWVTVLDPELVVDPLLRALVTITDLPIATTLRQA